MKRLFFVLILFILIAAAVSAQQTGVTAEAMGQANLRATTDVSAALVGEITVGTRYPVLARSEMYPWLLLGDPVTGAALGWVFQDLVTVQGNVNAVPYSTLVVDPSQPAAPADGSPTPTLASAEEPVITGTAATPTQTPSPAQYTVSASVQGEVNIRYGPGADYPRIGVAMPGQRLEVTAYHSQFPWLQVRMPDDPTKFGWIAQDLLDVQGDVFSLAPVSQAALTLPTLTPTPAQVKVSSLLATSEVALSPEFAALGEQLWDIMLTNGFDPQTSRFGALFVMDLQTGEAFTLGEEFAFSGTSINKISILADLYRVLDAPPDTRTATDIANTMICSENVATNRLLSDVGGGSEYDGAEAVTEFLNLLGLERTFLTAPYTVATSGTPPPPPRPIRVPETEADQEKASPDPSNQITVDEMGWLLGSIYECGYGEGGPLMEQFPDQYEPRECRQILHVMSSNNVDALLKAGVPADTRVAHKHGWIADTHGNAAVFFTPGGDYVMTMMLFQPTWLNFEESLPVIAEVSRQVYNYFNPDAPQDIVREGFIPEATTCNFAGTPLIADLQEFNWDQ